MLLTHCWHVWQGVRATGAGDGDGGAGLGWQVLSSSQPSKPPMQRQIVTLMSLLQTLSKLQSESKMQVLLGTPAANAQEQQWIYDNSDVSVLFMWSHHQDVQTTHICLRSFLCRTRASANKKQRA